MTKYRNFRESGGAVVETALMLLIMVPLLFYVFLMSDVSMHLLEVQEAVIATTWDFSTAPYGFGKTDWASSVRGSGSVDSYNRQQYTDHESSYIDFEATATDSAGNEYNDFGSENNHHNEPFAHACWLGPSGQGRESRYSQYTQQGSTQVVCEKQSDWLEPLSLSRIAGLNTFQSIYDEGGRFNCWAKAWVLNYLVPTTFMPEFNQAPLYDKTKFERGSNAHSNSSASGNNNLLLKARASIFADTWAALKDHVYVDRRSGSSERYQDYGDYEINALNDILGIQLDISRSASGIFSLLGNVGAMNIQQIIQGLLGLQSDLHGRVGTFFLGGIDLLGFANNDKTSAILEYQRALANNDLGARWGMPQPALLWMAATYSHRGSRYNVDDYMFKPRQSILSSIINPVSGIHNYFSSNHCTTPSEQYLRRAGWQRGEYYLGGRRPVQ